MASEKDRAMIRSDIWDYVKKPEGNWFELSKKRKSFLLRAEIGENYCVSARFQASSSWHMVCVKWHLDVTRFMSCKFAQWSTRHVNC